MTNRLAAHHTFYFSNITCIRFHQNDDFSTYKHCFQRYFHCTSLLYSSSFCLYVFFLRVWSLCFPVSFFVSLFLSTAHCFRLWKVYRWNFVILLFLDSSTRRFLFPTPFFAFFSYFFCSFFLSHSLRPCVFFLVNSAAFEDTWWWCPTTWAIFLTSFNKNSSSNYRNSSKKIEAFIKNCYFSTKSTTRVRYYESKPTANSNTTKYKCSHQNAFCWISVLCWIVNRDGCQPPI